MRRRLPLVSALEFRCCRMIPLANHKLTFDDERVGYITRHDDFVPRSHREFLCKLLLSSKIAKAEALIVEPVKQKTSEFIWFNLTSNRDFNGENFFSLSAALPYDPFRSMANNWHQYGKLRFVFHTVLGFATIWFNTFFCFFIDLVGVLLSHWHCHCCYF